MVDGSFEKWCQVFVQGKSVSDVGSFPFSNSTSSSSSDDNFKSLKTTKGRGRGRGRVGDRLSFAGKGRGGALVNKKVKHPKGYDLSYLKY